MDSKAKIFASMDSDIEAPFKSIIIIDDDPLVCDLFCNLISVEYPNVTVIGCCSPETGLEICKLVYLDIVLCDINMPQITGDKLIMQIKNISPAVYTIAMTGISLKIAFAAGKCNPDDFIDKNQGQASILDAIAKGFGESEKRKINIFGKHYNSREGTIDTRNCDAHGKMEFIKAFGFAPGEYMISRKNTKTLALLKIRRLMTKEEIALIAGYGSSQRMRENLKKILPLTEFNKIDGN